jgi:hypothetical protein
MIGAKVRRGRLRGEFARKGDYAKESQSPLQIFVEE